MPDLSLNPNIGTQRAPRVSPYPDASLYLDFLTMSANFMDSRITFSRGTNATLTDSTGRVTFAPNNTFTNSGGPFSATGVTTSTASGAAPDGTNAVRLTKTDATTPRYSNWTTLFTVQGNTAYVASAYFKYDGFDTTVSLEYNNATNFGIGWVATFNVTASGITANTPLSCTSGVQAVGNGWFRVWAAFTSGTPSTPTNPFVLTRITGGTSTTVLVAWGQLELVTYQTTPSTYVATTSAAYYGPRFDYDPVTLAPRGLLIEEQRTNLLTYSAQFDNAFWQKTNITVTSAATVSPDGTTNAQRIAATASAATNIFSTNAAVAATSATYSVYVKQGTGPTTANSFAIRNNTTATTLLLVTVNLATGTVISYINGTTGASLQNAGNGWWRVVLTVTSGVTSGDLLSGYVGFVGGAQTAGDFLYAWGAQLEAGAFATSYIPTVASTVTRNADVATMTGTNFSSWYNQTGGTIVASTFIGNRPSLSLGIYAFDDGTTNNALPAFYGGAVLANSRVGGSNVFTSTSAALSAAPGVFNIAFAYQNADYASSFNGAAPTTQTSGAVPSGLNRLQLGAYNGYQINGHIRTLAYFNTRQPNAQLQTLTAPALVPSLSLDFLNNVYNVGF